jgi:hypothetical protein
MFLIRDIMYCRPGKVRPMIERFVAMARISEKAGMGKMRVTTDVAAERFWTIVAEMEVESLDSFMQMDTNMDPEVAKQFEELMKDYHELVDHGRREIYKIES